MNRATADTAIRAALLAGLMLAPAPAAAQTAPVQATAAPAQDEQHVAYPMSPPVSISSPFAVNWLFNTTLVCMTFTNVSDRPLQAVRFGITALQQNALGGSTSSGYVDRVGIFAPGVAIRPPTRFLGTVNQNSPALANCWTTAGANASTLVKITVLKAVYADGTVWVNPSPTSALATLTF